MPLYIVSTPIGNLSDITLRSLEILRNADIILCKDTRQSLKLLNSYEIKPDKLISFYSQIEEKKINQIILTLKENKEINIALITDNGTPTISDPGFKLVDACYNNNIEVFAAPGPSAFLCALSISGFSADTFLFYGFLPRKDGKIKKVLKDLININGLIIFYESPFRVKNTLKLICDIFGKEIPVFIARELTKKFEQKLRGKVGDLLLAIGEECKGEFVIIINNYKVNRLINDNIEN